MRFSIKLLFIAFHYFSRYTSTYMKILSIILGGIGSLGGLIGLAFLLMIVILRQSSEPLDKSYTIGLLVSLTALVLGFLGSFVPIFANDKTLIILGEGAALLSFIIIVSVSGVVIRTWLYGSL